MLSILQLWSILAVPKGPRSIGDDENSGKHVWTKFQSFVPICSGIRDKCQILFGWPPKQQICSASKVKPFYRDLFYLLLILVILEKSLSTHPVGISISLRVIRLATIEWTRYEVADKQSDSAILLISKLTKWKFEPPNFGGHPKLAPKIANR